MNASTAVWAVGRWPERLGRTGQFLAGCIVGSLAWLTPLAAISSTLVAADDTRTVLALQLLVAGACTYHLLFGASELPWPTNQATRPLVTQGRFHVAWFGLLLGFGTSTVATTPAVFGLAAAAAVAAEPTTAMLMALGYALGRTAGVVPVALTKLGDRGVLHQAIRGWRANFSTMSRVLAVTAAAATFVATTG